MFWYIGKIILFILIWLGIIYFIYWVIKDWNDGGKFLAMIVFPIVLVVVILIVCLIKFPMQTLAVIGICLFDYGIYIGVKNIKKKIKNKKSEKEKKEKIVLNDEKDKGKEVKQVVEYVCSECGQKVSKHYKKCPHCKAELIWK